MTEFKCEVQGNISMPKMFLNACLNTDGSVNSILVEELKTHVLGDENLGPKFWEEICSLKM